MSLLREIQSDLTNSAVDVITVLRKCKILAARLGSEEFAKWVEWELNGYPDSQPTPGYRRLGAICRANFMNIAWQANQQPVPLSIIPEKHRDTFLQVEFREGIAKLEMFASGGAHIPEPDLAILLQGRMYPDMNCVGAWREVAATEFAGLLSAVKNRILDFVLKIEAENPEAGDALPNSEPIPHEKLQSIVNNFFAPVGNVAQNSRDFSQTANIGTEDLTRLVSEFTNHLDELNLDSRQKQKVHAQIATLKAQLDDEPDPVIVKQAGRTLRNITEGAIGSLLATAAQLTVWHWVQQTMAKLFSS